MNISNSITLYNQAKKVIPGGVNSPVRAFKSVGGQPIFIERGKGSRLYDVDGNSYIDYVCSWGPLIFGHAYPPIINAIKDTAENGTTFGASTSLEVELAEMLVDAVPSIDMVRLVNSGTEALMSAIRVARGFTNRSKIIKFEGCYHGHSDSLLAKAGSGLATFGLPDSAGVPANVTADTIVLPYNNLDIVAETIIAMPGEVACIVLEPIAGNMGVVVPKPGYLAGLRELCDANGIVLIFDEVISGFRVSYGGAQELYGITPDMTTLGKIIGGGLPVGAYGGKREIMECVAPLGPVYQAGTLSGNPLAVSAGIATLKALREPGFYDELERKAITLENGIDDAASCAGVRIQSNRVGSMMTAFFADKPIFDYTSAKEANTDLYAQYFNGMLEHGVYLAPSQFEAAFVSSAHSDEDIENTINASSEVFKVIKR